MEFYLILLPLILTVLLQIFLALISKVRYKSIFRYSMPTLKNMSVSDVIKLYVEEYPLINIEVIPKFKQNILSGINYILVDSEFLSEKSIWSKLLTLWHLEFSQISISNKFLLNSPRILFGLFMIQIALIFAVFFVDNNFYYVLFLCSSVLSIITLIILFFAIKSYKNFVLRVLFVSSSIFEMDELEETRAKIILDKINYQWLEYPFELIIRLSKY